MCAHAFERLFHLQITKSRSLKAQSFTSMFHVKKSRTRSKDSIDAFDVLFSRFEVARNDHVELPGSGTFSCCSSVLQRHTHVCLTCVTYHWLDQVNGTLLMKAMKISSVVSWFQLGFDLSLFIFIRLSIS